MSEEGTIPISVMRTSQQATVAKLKVIAADAQRRHDEASKSADRHYWQGWHDGVKRAMRVVNGEG